ncbi:hypothetical protein M0811_13055 [Anaeramoeba ignava]|uniref:Uncharacterized protein n=1 Tax=Anaeramoeba ignava TaxID=1746090 RepID=A0A9Q0L6J1_ANAIG|nr:hypothetical protein M0811_13055 [Anaeramoeba ignava]
MENQISKSIQENQNNILPVVTLSNTQFLENNSNEAYKILNFYLNLNQIYENNQESQLKENEISDILIPDTKRRR